MATGRCKPLLRPGALGLLPLLLLPLSVSSSGSSGSHTGDPSQPCEHLRRAIAEAASAGLRFYAAGLPTGAARTGDRSEDLAAAQEAYRRLAYRLGDVEDVGGFARCVPSDRAGGAAARLCYTLVLLLIEGERETRHIKLGSPAYGAHFADLFSPEIFWSDMLHSGWPVFRMAALVEHDVRHPTSESLTFLQLYKQGDMCNAQHEEFRETMVLLSGEGRTSRVMDLRPFLRHSFSGDDVAFEAGEYELDVLYTSERIPGDCPAVMALTFAALADALQCHWHRPQSTRTHKLANDALRRAQAFAGQVWGSSDMASFFSSKWPVLQYLGRLRPPSIEPASTPEQAVQLPQDGPEHEAREAGAAGEVAQRSVPPVLVSWSSREAELGGLNWAANFAEELFGDSPGFMLQEDVECAHVVLYRAKLPPNFGGVLVFVDGERSPEDSEYQELLSSYPASIVIGPLPAGGVSKTFRVSYASTCFAHRETASPASLLAPRHVPSPGQRRFAAYIAFKCWPHREEFYNLLNKEAWASGRGGVDALSRCGNSTAVDKARSQRYSRSYQDDAAALFSRYRFALVFENRLSQRYVTEKIVNAFLGGAIPIYWGSPFVFRIFNPAAFIYVNHFTSFQAAVRRVLAIDRDPELYASYASAPILQNTTEARWLLSWHRDAPSLPEDVPSLREEVVAEVLKLHQQGLAGRVPAVEMRPWDHAYIFEKINF